VSAKRLSSALADAEAVLDFSSVAGNQLLYTALKDIENKNFYLLIGTTGLDKAMIKSWKSLANQRKHYLLFAPNTSLGIMFMTQIAKQLAAKMANHGFDIEIVESHHRNKI